MNNNEIETLSFDEPNMNNNPLDNSLINDVTSELKIPATELNNPMSTDSVMNTNPVQPVTTEVPPVEQPVMMEQPVEQNTSADSELDTSNTASNQAMVNMDEKTASLDDMSNISYDTKDTYTEFAEQKPKKKFPLTTIILILLVLLVAGAGVWYFFIYKEQGVSIGGTASPVAAKELIIELGADIPSDISQYINRELKETEYKLDNKKIDNHSVGEYEFTVKYNGTEYVGKAIVKDTTAPVVSTKNVTLKDASSIVPGDFIDECTDLSGCSVIFDSNVDTTTFTEPGDYTINLIASDDYQNKTNVTAKLTIDSNAVALNILTCTKEIMKNDQYNRKFTDKFVITYDDNNELVSSVRTQISKMTDKTLYEQYKTDKASVNTGTYDDNSMTYTEVINKTKDETMTSLMREVSSLKNTDLNKNIHSSNLTTAGYTCK